MHELAFPLLVSLIVVALAFDFLNGLHDAANSIATVVGTRLLRPLPRRPKNHSSRWSRTMWNWFYAASWSRIT